jgi:hypothetical protein
MLLNNGKNTEVLRDGYFLFVPRGNVPRAIQKSQKYSHVNELVRRSTGV